MTFYNNNNQNVMPQQKPPPKKNNQIKNGVHPNSKKEELSQNINSPH
jgi:hypothetical protein